MYKIEGKNVVLEQFTNEHLKISEYYSWLRNDKVIKTLFQYEYFLNITTEKLDEYITKINSSTNDVYFIIKLIEGDKYIGTAKIGHIDWRLGIGDVGVMIGDTNYWGKGIATEVISIISDFGFERLSLRKLTAATSSINQGMVKCFKKNGYHQEGIKRESMLMQGVYADQVFFGCFKNELIKF
jgi:ribosomal-protein-alanine N-acetyltransferase